MGHRDPRSTEIYLHVSNKTEATVTYAVKDYKNKGQWKEKTVPGEEFIRRFLMHGPPKRFVRIRH